MKAFEGTFSTPDGIIELMLIGANSMSAAAKKAEDVEEANGSELIKLELTDKVIL
jgi:N-acetylmuramic acid 6-phosphate (MurNAc-6-P) etherase